MTKKDYTLIAEAVRQMYSLGENHLYVADMLAVKLAQDNPRFDRQKFLTACGIDMPDWNKDSESEYLRKQRALED